MYIRIDYSDGQFSVAPSQHDTDIYVSEEWWARYEAFRKDARFWHEVISNLDSLAFHRREERARRDA